MGTFEVQGGGCFDKPRLSAATGQNGGTTNVNQSLNNVSPLNVNGIGGQNLLKVSSSRRLDNAAQIDNSNHNQSQQHIPTVLTSQLKIGSNPTQKQSRKAQKNQK